MQVHDRSGAAERLVLVSQITDDIVCGRIASQWPADGGLYGSKFANLIGSWATKYYLLHGKAPRSDIEGLCNRWAARSKDSETVSLVESFLESLSEDWLRTPNSSEYILDRSQEYFTEVSLRNMAQSVQAALDAGDVAGASAIQNKATVPHLAGATWYNPWTDALAMQEAFAAKADPLITYDGDLGLFLGSVLERDAFVAFRGIAKVGKSFTLMDLAYRGLCQKRKVAYFAIGDMSKDQVNLRWASRITRSPRIASTVLIPRGWDEDADPTRPVPAREEKHFPKSLNPGSVMTTAAKTLRQKGLDPEFARFSIHPSRSLTVYGLRSILQGWEREGFLPEVVVLDYIDLLGSIPGVTEKRESIDETWAQMRGLSQQYHNLIVTASQSDAQGYKADVLGMENFNGSRTQNDHVTAMISLNQTADEHEHGVVRWHMFARDNPEKRQVAVAGCRAVGSPIILSKFCAPPE